MCIRDRPGAVQQHGVDHYRVLVRILVGGSGTMPEREEGALDGPRLASFFREWQREGHRDPFPTDLVPLRVESPGQTRERAAQLRDVFQVFDVADHHRVGADRQLGIEDDGIAPPREVDVLL